MEDGAVLRQKEKIAPYLVYSRIRPLSELLQLDVVPVEAILLVSYTAPPSVVWQVSF